MIIATLLLLLEIVMVCLFQYHSLMSSVSRTTLKLFFWSGFQYWIEEKSTGARPVVKPVHCCDAETRSCFSRPQVFLSWYFLSDVPDKTIDWQFVPEVRIHNAQCQHITYTILTDLLRPFQSWTGWVFPTHHEGWIFHIEFISCFITCYNFFLSFSICSVISSFLNRWYLSSCLWSRVISHGGNFAATWCVFNFVVRMSWNELCWHVALICYFLDCQMVVGTHDFIKLCNRSIIDYVECILTWPIFCWLLTILRLLKPFITSWALALIVVNVSWVFINVFPSFEQNIMLIHSSLKSAISNIAKHTHYTHMNKYL